MSWESKDLALELLKSLQNNIINSGANFDNIISKNSILNSGAVWHGDWRNQNVD